MPLICTRALILQAFPYSETSKILRLFTLDNGLRSVIAKGAQRPKSRFGGLLEPFTEGDAHFFLREGRELHTLSGFDLVRGRQAIGRNLTVFAAASLLSELVLRSGTEEPHPQLYRSLVASLDQLASTPPERAVVDALASVWSLVALLGFQPELQLCVSCGRPFAPAEPSRFDVEAGGAACLSCRPTGRLVDAGTRNAVLEMAGGGTWPAEVGDLSTQRALLRVFLATHLSHGVQLRSLPLLLEQLR